MFHYKYSFQDIKPQKKQKIKIAKLKIFDTLSDAHGRNMRVYVPTGFPEHSWQTCGLIFVIGALRL